VTIDWTPARSKFLRANAARRGSISYVRIPDEREHGFRAKLNKESGAS
jgi:hypothetical protein